MEDRVTTNGGHGSARRWWSVVVGVLFVVILAGLWVVSRERIPEKEKELASVTSASGMRFVVHRVELSKEMVLRGSEAKLSLDEFVSTRSSRTRSLGTLSFQTEVKSGRFESATFSRQMPSLMLLARVYDDRGEVLSSDELGWVTKSSRGGLVKRDKIGLFDEVDSSRGGAPPWRVEVSDGGGGWLQMSDPIIAYAPGGRAFHFCPSFPRETSTLQLRVRFDGDPQNYELDVPNPGFAKTFPAWVADPKPWRKDLGEVAVEVEKMKRVELGAKPFTEVKLRAVPQDDQLPEAWAINWLGQSDRFGNQAAEWEFERIPGTELVRYDYEIEPSDKYRWSVADCVVLGELVLPAKAKIGQVVATRVSPAGRDLGIESLMLSWTADSSFRDADRRLWQIRYSGTGSKAQALLAAQRPFTLVLGDESRSAGIRGCGYDGSSSGEDIEGGFGWTGEISAGQRVRIVLPIYRPPIPFSFTFETEELDRVIREAE